MSSSTPPVAGTVRHSRQVNRTSRRGAPPRAARRQSCQRVPLCLLETLRAGAPVAVVRDGQRWAVSSADKVLARRKRKEAADELLAAAMADVASTTPPAAELDRRTVVVTPQRPQGEAAVYTLVEAADLVPSHRPDDFQPDPLYPAGIQERAYASEMSEKLKVRQGAQSLRPDLLLARTPSPLDGPPLVTEPPSPLVLGGNGRTMMILLAYRDFPDQAKAYREALSAAASSFGFPARDVERMRAPVLVRVMEGLTRSSPREELRAAVRRFNVGMTQGMDPMVSAVAQARTLSPDAVRDLGKLLATSDASLRELMRTEPVEISRVLERAAIITRQNRSEWVTAAGAFTERAKDTLEGMFLGLVLETPERIRATPPALLQKVERAATHLVAVRATLPEAFDLIPALSRAVDALNDARVRGLTFTEWTAQASLFGDTDPLDETARRLGELLDEQGPRQVGEAFRRWAAAAAHDPAQGMLLGEAPTPASALSILLKRKANPRKRRVTCTTCGGSGRVSPWAQKIDWCPVCGGTGQVEPPQAEDPAQLRLINPSVPKRDSLVSTAKTTGALARQLVETYGGASFPSRLEVVTGKSRRLVLTFEGGKLTKLTRKGKPQPELLEALQNDLARRHPLT